MSDDLISRKVLVERVKYLFTHTNEGTPEHYAYGVVLNEIRELPTAFDRGKVIEELRKYTTDKCELHECGIRSEYCSVCIAKKSIEIVEKGGIE